MHSSPVCLCHLLPADLPTSHRGAVCMQRKPSHWLPQPVARSVREQNPSERLPRSSHQPEQRSHSAEMLATMRSYFCVHLYMIQICRAQEGDRRRWNGCRRTVENQRRIESSLTPRAISASSPNPTIQSTANIRGVTQTCSYQRNMHLQI